MKNRPTQELLDLERQCRKTIGDIVSNMPLDNYATIRKLIVAPDIAEAFNVLVEESPDSGRNLIRASFSVLVNSFVTHAISEELNSRQN